MFVGACTTPHKDEASGIPPADIPQFTHIKNTLSKEDFLKKSETAKEEFKKNVEIEKDGINLTEQEENEQFDKFYVEIAKLFPQGTDDPCDFTKSINQAYKKLTTEFGEMVDQIHNANKEGKLKTAPNGSVVLSESGEDKHGTHTEYTVSGSGNDTQIEITYSLKVRNSKEQGAVDIHMKFLANLPEKKMTVESNLQPRTARRADKVNLELSLNAGTLMKLHIKANGVVDKKSGKIDYSVEQTKRRVLKIQGEMQNEGKTKKFEKKIDLDHCNK